MVDVLVLVGTVLAIEHKVLHIVMRAKVSYILHNHIGERERKERKREETG